MPTASSIGLNPNYVIEGDKAKLMDSLPAEHTGKLLGPADLNADMNATVMLKSQASVLKMDRYIARMSSRKGFASLR